MILKIADILTQAELDALREVLAERDVFEDGRETAGWHARARKDNLQAAGSPRIRGIQSKLEKALLANATFQAAARPKAAVRILLTRYEPGMAYGAHVDDALMDGRRTDVSFTLFLADPESYKGGALVIDDTEGERSFKLSAGDLILYPATTLHRVAPVTEGVRLAAVGWVRSLVRDAGQREILFDLECIVDRLREREVDDGALELALKTRSNLLRRWVED